ncbi:hypothetical protein L2E82_37637 [Cichorium intybus]|uniref:Uncharacterized protein n=1 Tax=Cichorium intybus TaxID=13427 RepID=A0ACB9AE98_CICIN|nr:hypothetical protein L2E82_37637 [Cichorium intybus]
MENLSTINGDINIAHKVFAFIPHRYRLVPLLVDEVLRGFSLPPPSHNPSVMEIEGLEFLRIVVHLIKISNNEQLQEALRHFDKNQNGYLKFN